MNLRIVMALAVCGMAGWAVADEVETPGTPPKWAVVTANDAEPKTVTVMFVVPKPVYETYQYTVEVDGKQETRTATRVQQVSEVRMQILKLADCRVVTAAKEKLDEGAALKRLAANTPVLLHTGGQKLDARYLSLLKDDTIIVVMPAPMPMPNDVPTDAPAVPRPIAPAP